MIRLANIAVCWRDGDDEHLLQMRGSSVSAFLELGKTSQLGILCCSLTMQRCRHRIAPPLAKMTSDTAAVISAAGAVPSAGAAACLDTLARMVGACEAPRSAAEPMRSSASMPVQMLRTPCTDAMPQLGCQQTRSAGAAAASSRFQRQLCRERCSDQAQRLSGQAAVASRSFAADAPQTQAEKFDVIQQEAGAVRIEG